MLICVGIVTSTQSASSTAGGKSSSGTVVKAGLGLAVGLIAIVLGILIG